ncbi:MAG: DUF167 domain-containing protein [Planctomycetes bacterium]|nr:DUF167 domain-containing protein [Planctomycetota bacterium]
MSGAERALELGGDEHACRLSLRAQPGARRSGVVGLWNGHLKVAVRAPAEDGRANEELLSVLAEALELPRRALTLERGAQARLKQVSIAAPRSQIAARLQALLEPGDGPTESAPRA